VHAGNLGVSDFYFIMFKELVSLAIIVGFILNILYVEHPDTNSYTIAFVLSMAVFSPFALAWRYRASLSQLGATKNPAQVVEGQLSVSVSGVRVGKGVRPIADVELGLIQTEDTASAPLEGT
jgi:membrane protease YdiL (CAAX protease family)